MDTGINKSSVKGILFKGNLLIKGPEIQVFLWLFLGLFSASVFSASASFQVNRFELEGTVPVDQAFIDELLTPYQNQSHSVESVLEVSAVLEKALHDEGYSFYRVVLPEQPVGKSGIVKLKIVAFTLGTIDIDGNKHFDDENIFNALPGLVIGESPNPNDLVHELKVASHHPLKNVRLTFKQSKTVNQLRATVDVVDAKPDNFALILSNTGSDSTGDYRLTGSYQHTNLFNKDHILNLSYTTSPEQTGDVKQYGGSYSLPIYSQRAWLTGYMVQSDVDSGTIAGLDISGAGTMMGLHYLRYLGRIDTYEHWLDVGFDDRLFENDILFGTFSLIPDVRSAPISLTYKGEFPWRQQQFNFHVQYNANTGMGSDNNKLAYWGNRLYAERNWSHMRYGMTVTHAYKGWELKGNLSGQYTDDILISGEQFGLGGATSVRGYEEREISKDNGYTIKLEVSRPWFEKTRLVGFADFGEGSSENVLPGDPPKTQTIASIGAGIRWQYENKFLASIDLAHALKEGAAGQTDDGDNKIHATVMMNF